MSEKLSPLISPIRAAHVPLVKVLARATPLIVNNVKLPGNISSPRGSSPMSPLLRDTATRSARRSPLRSVPVCAVVTTGFEGPHETLNALSAKDPVSVSTNRARKIFDATTTDDNASKSSAAMMPQSAVCIRTQTKKTAFA